MVNKEGRTHFGIFVAYYVSTTPLLTRVQQNIWSTPAHRPLLTYLTGRVYNVHQVQNIWSARAQEQHGARAQDNRGARAQDQPLTSHESQPSELQGG